MARKAGLGRGLEALIPAGESTQPNGGSLLVPVNKILPNPLQPRTEMHDEELNEMANSIREHGILMPLIVTQNPESDRYTLIAGERRLRAAQLAGLEMVPVIVRQATDEERLELALIENLQRSDLNPLETADAYNQLSQTFKLSHEEIAQKVGKSRAAITNTLRLLNLTAAARQALLDGRISEGHARAILGLESSQAQNAALQTIVSNRLNVRQAEDLIKKFSGERPVIKPKPPIPAEIRALEERLRQNLGTKVSLKHGKQGGTITIYYFSDEELESLLKKISKI
jgi:ParB family chromosome partitioning protein